MPSEEHPVQVPRQRKMTDGLPPKAQIVYALTALWTGAGISVYFKSTGMETSLALPLGLFVGFTGVTFATGALWFAYCRWNGDKDAR